LLAGLLVAAEDQREGSVWLGIAVSESTPEGLVVRMVLPDSPAAKAGLSPGDRVLRLDDQILCNREQLQTLLARYEDGQQVSLRVVGGTPADAPPSQVAVTLSKRPDAADPDVHPPASRVGKGDGSSPWWLETHQRSRDDLARSVQRLEALRSRLQDLEADLQQRRESIEQSLDDLQDVANKMREDAEALDRHAAALRSDAEEGIQDIEKHGEYRVIKSRTVIRSGDLKLLIDKDDRVQAFRDGKVIYEGPKDPEDGAEPLPDEVRRLLDGFLKIESRIVPANESAP